MNAILKVEISMPAPHFYSTPVRVVFQETRESRAWLLNGHPGWAHTAGMEAAERDWHSIAADLQEFVETQDVIDDPEMIRPATRSEQPPAGKGTGSTYRRQAWKNRNGQRGLPTASFGRVGSSGFALDRTTGSITASSYFTELEHKSWGHYTALKL